MLLKLVHGKQSRTLALWYCRVGKRALGLLLIMSAGLGRSTGDDSPWRRYDQASDAIAWKCYAYLHDVTYLWNLGSSVFLRNADNQVG